MGKLGKKARKFSKKNLQSVLRRNRKLNSKFNKKKTSKRGGQEDTAKDQKKDAIELSNARNTEAEYIENNPLDTIFSEDDSDVFGDDSDSDGYLSEDSDHLHLAHSENENSQEGNFGSSSSALSVQNSEIQLELVKKTKKLDKLKEKDPEFSNFLKSYHKGSEQLRNKVYADEDEISDEDMQPDNVGGVNFNGGKLLTSSAIDSWCQLVREHQSVPALTSLLNGYRAACHYGAESTRVIDADSCHGIQNSETFCKTLIFMLNEADNIFRGLMGMSSSNPKKEKNLDLTKNSKWNTLKPLIKSYLRSTLFLLNEVNDSEILAFSLARIRASMTFFVAFPSLLRRLIKVAVHLWATGRGTISSLSSLIIRDVASVFRSDCFDTCFVNTYKSFIGHCQFLEPVLFQHIQFLRNSFVELCSVDLQKASRKASVSIQQLAKILKQGLLTKKKEAVKKICSWQYTSCIDLWVMFISANIHDYDLHPLLFTIIQIINGVAVLFSGPRYLPLRIKCIQWLNHLSSSTGIFIPVASVVLDILEYKIGKDVGKPGKDTNILCSVKFPKHWLKSRNFQEQCVLSVIELLAAHFAQWSHHISFPDLATIPLVRLRKFHEITTIESFKRIVKRFIDQVEQNIEFVRKKRDEVPFSPKDQQSVESFLQLEKHSGNTSFAQYYKSIMDKAASRNLAFFEKFSGAEEITKKAQKKIKQSQKERVTEGVNGRHSGKRKGTVSVDCSREGKMRRKEKS
ncbi:PREDICTED: nucleolar complex protein 2 homolog [Prunus mume]|uniref:Nucleolar complex protein 2 homolog n=1 Tax=Prunus mume TaxID=102107 RepID=A0ABM0P292_PRUMU|nr:PREDICTED: nucleolar complex protein 2 homolog [Prunus mume]XP_008233361.1 PREDICTED: nucleolar complex protein 2 homolog [Prunus mume]